MDGAPRVAAAAALPGSRPKAGLPGSPVKRPNPAAEPGRNRGKNQARIGDRPRRMNQPVDKAVPHLRGPRSPEQGGQAVDWLTQVVERWGYLGLVAVVALENLFPPIPSEVVIPFAGFLTSLGVLTLPGVIAASTAGSVLGALVLYGLGRVLGRRRLEALTRRYGHYLGVHVEQVEKAEAWFSRHGPWAVLAGRVVPIVRSLISIPAGIAEMPAAVFVVYTVLGTLVWNTALAAAGAALGAAWPLVQEWVRVYQHVLLVVVLAAAAVGIGLRLAGWPRR